MKRDYTATCYLFEGDRTLLIYHKKLKKWLPPGGHVEENETPPEAARREVVEESGLEVEFLLEENLWINEPNARSFERPYLCLLEEIPAFGDVPAHQHVDFIYVGQPVGGSLIAGEWMSLAEVEALDEIFPDTQQTIRQIFTLLPSLSV